jgi:cytochrome b561
MNTIQVSRYSGVAIVLHWAIAFAIFGMIPLGWWMGDAVREPATQAQAAAAFQLHKSIGLTILALSLVRLIWRLMHPVPPMPAHMPRWERLAASGVHWAFYGLMIAMPLTGWLYVSTGWDAIDDRALDVPTLWFGLFQVPHLFGLSHLGYEARSFLSATIGFTHSKLAWGAIGLAALHVGAALKHHFFDQDDVLTRMVPGLRSRGAPAPIPPRNVGRLAVLGIGGAAILLAAGLAAFAFFNPPAATRAASAPEAPAQDVQAPASAPAPVEAPSAAAAQAAPAPAETAAPPQWRVDYAASAIRYSGVHIGAPFEGAFSRWRADIRFDPDNLEASRVSVIIETASASDGDTLHDETLPGREWFDVANHAQARFEASRFSRRADGGYEARGTLTLKGQALPVTLPFTLAISGERAVMDGALEIDRGEADLGQGSDPDGEFVSRTIGVSVHVEARRAA